MSRHFRKEEESIKKRQLSEDKARDRDEEEEEEEEEERTCMENQS